MRKSFFYYIFLTTFLTSFAQSSIASQSQTEEEKDVWCFQRIEVMDDYCDNPRQKPKKPEAEQGEILLISEGPSEKETSDERNPAISSAHSERSCEETKEGEGEVKEESLFVSEEKKAEEVGSPLEEATQEVIQEVVTEKSLPSGELLTTEQGISDAEAGKDKEKEEGAVIALEKAKAREASLLGRKSLGIWFPELIRQNKPRIVVTGLFATAITLLVIKAELNR